MTGIVIDCVKPPSVAAMRAAGVTGLSRYLSTLSSDPLGKIIHKAEYDSLIAEFDVVLNWEHAATDWLGGASAGASHASQAVSQARALGYPTGCAIIGSADFNMTAAQWASSCKAYAQAYSAGIRSGGYLAGVYGPYDVLTWCQQLGGFAVYWQAGMSTSWSGGRNKNPWPGAHLRQRRGATIGGVSVDENDILIARYGQAPLGDDDVSVKTDNIIAAWAQGNAAGSGGEDVEPVKWRVRDEAWQTSVTTALATLATAVNAVKAPALTDSQVDTFAQAVAAKLIASNANGLTAADHTAIVTDVKTALRAGTGS